MARASSRPDACATPSSRICRARPVRRTLEAYVDKRRAGPSDERRAAARSFIWGEVRDARSGRIAVSRLQTLEGYTLTAQAAIRIAQRALGGDAPIGFQTPAKAYGADFVLELDETSRTDEPLAAIAS